MREVIYHPDALLEFFESGTYLESRRPGYGARFEAELDSALEKILSFPDAWTEIHPGVRRCHIKHFPYGVLYQVHDDCIFVVAIMALLRHPDYWKYRLG